MVIDEHDRTAGVEHESAKVNIGEELAEARLGRTEALLGFNTLCYVAGNAFDSHDGPVGIEHRHASMLGPQDRAIPTDPAGHDRLLYRGRVWRYRGSTVDEQAIVGMDEIPPKARIRVELLGGVAGQPCGRRADVLEERLRMHAEPIDDVLTALGQQSELVVAAIRRRVRSTRPWARLRRPLI